MSVTITITIIEDDQNLAWFRLQELAQSVSNNHKTVDTTTKPETISLSDSHSTPAAAPEKAPAKPRVSAKKAAPEPTPEPEVSEPEDTTSVDRDAIVSKITSVYRDGDDSMKAKIVEWRNSCGVKLLRDLKPEHMPSAEKFLREIVQ